MKQDDEDEVQFEQQQATDAAASEYEDTRRAREALQGKCLTGFVDFSQRRTT